MCGGRAALEGRAGLSKGNNASIEFSLGANNGQARGWSGGKLSCGRGDFRCTGDWRMTGVVSTSVYSVVECRRWS
jgi:hypothetical protein